MKLLLLAVRVFGTTSCESIQDEVDREDGRKREAVDKEVEEEKAEEDKEEKRTL